MPKRRIKLVIIVREKRKIGGKDFPSIKVYKSDSSFTLLKKDRELAEKIDNIIGKNMRQIEQYLKNKGILSLKGKKGKVLKLWYELGKRLSFIDTLDVSQEDRKWVFRALYDHAGELAPGPIRERAEKNPKRNHFFYCYNLGKYGWDVVEAAGDWSSWSEFFESDVIIEEPRIIEWLVKKSKDTKDIVSRRDWLRPLTRAIRNEFGRGCDTSVFSDEEIVEKLNSAFNKAQEEAEALKN